MKVKPQSASALALFLICGFAQAQSVNVSPQGVTVQGGGSSVGVQGANVTVQGGSSTVRAQGAGSHQAKTATVTQSGGDLAIKNGVVSNTQIGPGASATMNLGSRSVQPNSVITDRAPSERPPTGRAARGARSGAVSYVNEDIDGMNFAQANLAGVSFTNASAVGTLFVGANLTNANFVNADLEGANFRGADLRGANITNASWDNAQLSGARWVDGRVCREGSVARCL
jgi:Pentapeptide repeats (8 copies)